MNERVDHLINRVPGTLYDQTVTNERKIERSAPPPHVTFLAEEAVNTGGVVVAGKGEIEDDQASGML